MKSLNFWQNGRRGTRLAMATLDSTCRVAIEVGLCRSGRMGGSRRIAHLWIFERACLSLGHDFPRGKKARRSYSSIRPRHQRLTATLNMPRMADQAWTSPESALVAI